MERMTRLSGLMGEHIDLKGEDGEFFVPFVSNRIKLALKYLYELEDKLESGLLLELPCKVGDTVYYIDEYIVEFDKVEEYTVEKIEIVKDGLPN